MTTDKACIDKKKNCCDFCGKDCLDDYARLCSWDCSIEEAKENGGKIYTPNDLPINCITRDWLMLEHEHGDHPTYLFPVDVLFYKTPEELFASNPEDYYNDISLAREECFEFHALIYTDGCIAITMYEYCYAMWELRKGKLLGGHLWEKDEWVLSPKSLEKIREFSLNSNSFNHTFNKFFPKVTSEKTK